MKVFARVAVGWWALTALSFMVICTVNIWSPGKSPIEDKLLETWAVLGLTPAVVMFVVFMVAADI